MGRSLRCALATALLHLAGRPTRIVRPAKNCCHLDALEESVTVWNETHRSLVENMRALHLNESRDLISDLLALENGPIGNPQMASAPGSELLDRLAPDWHSRLHDGVVIDHILEVINRPRKPNRSRTSRSNPSRSLPPEVRQQTTLMLPRPLNSAGPREFSSDRVKRMA